MKLKDIEGMMMNNQRPTWVKTLCGKVGRWVYSDNPTHMLNEYEKLGEHEKFITIREVNGNDSHNRISVKSYLDVLEWEVLPEAPSIIKSDIKELLAFYKQFRDE